MPNFQQFVILFLVTQAAPGRIYYPTALKDQDVNAVLATYGQQGYEVIGQEIFETHGMVVLKKSA